MKFQISVLSTAMLLSLAACKSELDDKPSAVVSDAAAPAGAAADASASDAAQTRVLGVDAAKSQIRFVGAKVSDDHEGTFEQFDGEIELAQDQPKAMRFTVKTASIQTEPDKLEEHLKSADFLDVEKFPEATFVSSAIREKAADGATHEVEGALTMHGVTKTISFPATVRLEGDTAHGNAEFKLNRKDFGIVYPGMPDDLIKDDVLLQVKLVATGETKGKA